MADFLPQHVTIPINTVVFQRSMKVSLLFDTFV